MPERTVCTTCNGAGKSGLIECPTCKGSGILPLEVVCSVCNGGLYVDDDHTCPECFMQGTTPLNTIGAETLKKIADVEDNIGDLEDKIDEIKDVVDEIKSIVE